MEKDGKRLNVVNENDEIIGEETRENIHKQGLLHREVHVWMYNSNDEILFQHRSKTKDTFPDLLDASVGGHVELGMGYEESALKELKEETGVIAKREDIIFLKKMRTGGNYDPITKMTNNAMRKVYAYKYDMSKFVKD